MLTSITDDELAAFLTEQCLCINDTDRKKLTALSFSFLCTLPWCEDAEIDQDKFVQAQAFLIHAMSPEGNGFNPMATRGEAQLRRRSIGRSAIDREFFQQSEEFSGSDPISLLKTQSIPYGLLIRWLCPDLHIRNDTEADCDALTVFVV